MTPELAREGLARDLVRAVQQARKDAGLEVSDRITLAVGGDDEVAAAVEAHRDLVAGETLAEEVEALESPDGNGVAVVTVGDGHKAHLRVTRR